MMEKKRPPKHKHLFYIIPILILVILHIMGLRLTVPLTDSMEPTIPKGSLVLVVPTWLVKPKVGDVALYRIRITNEYLVLHRVVGATQKGLLTKGDNRAFRDPWVVEKEDVIGVAVLSIPFLGYMLLFLKPILLLASVFLAVFYSSYKLMVRVFGREE